MGTLQERLDRLFERIQEQDFVNQTGIGSDLPHYVLDYDAKDELMVREYIQYMLQRPSLHAAEVNLYHLLLELFQDDIDDLLDLGDEEGVDGLWEAIGPTLETNDFIEAFIEKAGDADIVFMTGVGSVHPFVRASKTLKRLSELSFRKPIILFYPGKFTGLQLHLYGIHHTEDEYQLSRIS